MGGLAKALDVLQTRSLKPQCRFFAFVEIGALDLGHLVPQHIVSSSDLALAREQLLALGPYTTQLSEHSRDVRPLGQSAGVTLERVELLASAQQGHMFRLSMDIDQPLSELLQNRDGHTPTIDASSAAATGAGYLA